VTGFGGVIPLIPNTPRALFDVGFDQKKLARGFTSFCSQKSVIYEEKSRKNVGLREKSSCICPVTVLLF
jgi:hypothetical protein